MFSWCIALYEEGRYFLIWSSTICTLSSTYVLDQIRKYLPSSLRDIKQIILYTLNQALKSEAFY